ncbi:unnamed protein product [Schistosoma margrebowiei]|uniref:Uncharacterized protein n=1 Tax=Schistosoma margrebowiei TaxID=48269 RepID=A0A183N912_9TREM|nr:unnamed protein product [Schistosoma margrebowiei]
MEEVRTRRGADTASDHHLVIANLKLKLEKHWTTGQTALHRFNTAFLRQTQQIQDKSQQQVSSLTGFTERRRNYYGGQLGMDQRSTNLNVLGGSGSQEASS